MFQRARFAGEHFFDCCDVCAVARAARPNDRMVGQVARTRRDINATKTKAFAKFGVYAPAFVVRARGARTVGKHAPQKTQNLFERVAIGEWADIFGRRTSIWTSDVLIWLVCKIYARKFVASECNEKIIFIIAHENIVMRL